MLKRARTPTPAREFAVSSPRRSRASSAPAENSASAPATARVLFSIGIPPAKRIRARLVAGILSAQRSASSEKLLFHLVNRPRGQSLLYADRQPFQFSKKSTRRRVTASGCSSWGRWPHCGIAWVTRLLAISAQTFGMSNILPTA